DGVVEADDAGEALAPVGQPCQEVVAELVLDRLVAVTGGPEAAEGGGGRRGGGGHARPSVACGVPRPWWPRAPGCARGTGTVDNPAHPVPGWARLPHRGSRHPTGRVRRARRPGRAGRRSRGRGRCGRRLRGPPGRRRRWGRRGG